MRRVLFASITGLLLAATTANAAIITVDVKATANDVFLFTDDIWPVGTDIFGTFSFDVGPGTGTQAPVSNGTGAFSWSIGSTQYSAILDGPVQSAGFKPAGFLTYAFQVTSVDFPGLVSVLVEFNVGTNPIGQETYDLLLGSSVFALGLHANDPNLGTIQAMPVAMKDVQSTVAAAAVPEPGTVGLFGLGLVAVARRLRRGSFSGSNRRPA